MVAINKAIVAARTNQMALENEAGLPATLLLIAFRTTVNIAKSRTKHASDTMNARNTINDAQRNPN
jgi:hypothetical protein